MMDDKMLNKFRSSLNAHRVELSRLLDEKDEKKRIYLGSTSIGEVLSVMSELQDTLQKLNQGNFGECQVCHEDVGSELLEMDYTACVCIDHLDSRQRRALEQDLELAGKVQRQLLSGNAPNMAGLKIAVHSQPAQIVGGDYYDFFSYPQGLQGFAMADVMGKGLAASMLMSNLQAALRIIGPENQNPVKIAYRLNQLFLHNLKLIRFISIFIGVIHPLTFRLKYCNAGHHPPLLWKESRKQVKLLEPTGPAIGLTREPVFGLKNISLERGDLLVLYTDGLPELCDEYGSEFGETRLINFLKEHHQLSAEEFISELRSTARSFAERIQDDISMMAIKRDY